MCTTKVSRLVMIWATQCRSTKAGFYDYMGSPWQGPDSISQHQMNLPAVPLPWVFLCLLKKREVFFFFFFLPRDCNTTTHTHTQNTKTLLMYFELLWLYIQMNSESYYLHKYTHKLMMSACICSFLLLMRPELSLKHEPAPCSLILVQLLSLTLPFTYKCLWEHIRCTLHAQGEAWHHCENRCLLSEC